MELKSVKLGEYNWLFERLDIVIKVTNSKNRKEAKKKLRTFINKIKKEKVTISD